MYIFFFLTCKYRNSIEKLAEYCKERGDELKSFSSITQCSALAGYSNRFVQVKTSFLKLHEFYLAQLFK